MSEAIADVIRTYPGWSLFCALIVALALINGLAAIVRPAKVQVVASRTRSDKEDSE